MELGCFTTMRVDHRHGGPGGIGMRGWELHVQRLQRDTTALFGEPVTREAMVSAVLDAAAQTPLPALVRLAVDDASGTISASTRRVTPSDEPMRVRSVRHDRMRPLLKHTHTLPEFTQRDAAMAEGFDDAVFLTADGFLGEGTTWSLVLGRPDGSWVTPRGQVLPSITLALIAARIPIAIQAVHVHGLAEFDRAAALGSGRGVHAIASIDGWTSTGSVEQLASAYNSVPLDSPH